MIGEPNEGEFHEDCGYDWEEHGTSLGMDERICPDKFIEAGYIAPTYGEFYEPDEGDYYDS